MATCKECLHYEACKGTYYEVKEQGVFDEEMYAECGCDDYKNKNKFVEMPCEVGDFVWYFDEESGHLVKGKVDGYLWFRSCGFALNVIWDKPIMGHFSYCRKEMPINEIGKTVFLSPEDFTKRYLDTSDLEKAVEHLERYKKLKESEQIENGDKEEQNG